MARKRPICPICKRPLKQWRAPNRSCEYWECPHCKPQGYVKADPGGCSASEVNAKGERIDE